MLLRNPQHVADHDHRQAVREVLDHVHRALAGDTIELLVDQLAERGRSRRHGRRRMLGHEAAQSRVIRRIDHQHGGATLANTGSPMRLSP